MFEQTPRLARRHDGFPCQLARECFGAAQIVIIGLPGRGRLEEGAFGLGLVHISGKNRNDCTYDLVLNREHITQFAVVPLGPAVGAGHGIDELRIDAHAVAHAPDIAFEDVADTQLPPNLPHVDRFAFVLKRRIACDHQKLGESRQLGDDVRRDAIAKILLLRVAAEIGEWQHGD